MSIRFNENDCRPIGRTARGVKAIELKEGDEVVGMAVADENKALLTVTETGENTFDILLYTNTGKVSQPMVTETITVNEHYTLEDLYEFILDFIKKVLRFFWGILV